MRLLLLAPTTRNTYFIVIADFQINFFSSINSLFSGGELYGLAVSFIARDGKRNSLSFDFIPTLRVMPIDDDELIGFQSIRK